MFVISFLTTVRISDSYTIAKAIEEYLLFVPFDEYSDTYYDIYSKTMLINFAEANLIQMIYNETMKDYPSSLNIKSDNYHFVQYFNYFMGMRVTYNRAQLSSTTEGKSGTDSTREYNYSENLSDSLSKVQTTDWGRNKTKYSKSNGFEGKGGYIIHFANDLTIDEATSCC